MVDEGGEVPKGGPEKGADVDVKNPDIGDERAVGSKVAQELAGSAEETADKDGPDAALKGLAGADDESDTDEAPEVDTTTGEDELVAEVAEGAEANEASELPPEAVELASNVAEAEEILNKNPIGRESKSYDGTMPLNPFGSTDNRSAAKKERADIINQAKRIVNTDKLTRSTVAEFLNKKIESLQRGHRVLGLAPRMVRNVVSLAPGVDKVREAADKKATDISRYALAEERAGVGDYRDIAPELRKEAIRLTAASFSSDRDGMGGGGSHIAKMALEARSFAEAYRLSGVDPEDAREVMDYVKKSLAVQNVA